MTDSAVRVSHAFIYTHLLNSSTPTAASPVQGRAGELLGAQLLVVVLGSVLVVVPELGLGQQGAELHCLLRRTGQMAGQEGLLDVQEEDMPAKQGGNEA